jgi:hypothetical protein
MRVQALPRIVDGWIGHSALSNQVLRKHAGEPAISRLPFVCRAFIAVRFTLWMLDDKFALVLRVHHCQPECSRLLLLALICQIFPRAFWKRFYSS